MRMAKLVVIASKWRSESARTPQHPDALEAIREEGVLLMVSPPPQCS